MSRPVVQTTDSPESITSSPEPVANAAGSEGDAASETNGRANTRLIVWGAWSLLWIGYLALGQVNARFWVLGQFKTDYKPIRDIWRIELGSLPGGDSAWMIQALVLTAILVFVVGVIAALYLLLVADDASSDRGDA